MITAEHMAAAAKHGRCDKGDEHSIHHRRASARAKRLEYDPSHSSARCRFETAPRQCAPQWRCGAHCPSAGRSGWTAASAPGSDRVSETNRQNFSDLEHLGLELLFKILSQGERSPWKDFLESSMPTACSSTSWKICCGATLCLRPLKQVYPPPLARRISTWGSSSACAPARAV